MIIVDASVAAKWFLPEAGSDEAQRLLAGSEKLVAPSLIRIEVFGAITRKVRNRELTVKEARSACELWSRALSKGALSLIPDERHLQRAIELAWEIRHPLQDAYISLLQSTTPEPWSRLILSSPSALLQTTTA